MRGYRRFAGLLTVCAVIVVLTLLEGQPGAFTALGLAAGAYFVSVGVQKFKQPED